MDPVLNSGDTAWMLISTALVMIMTVPGVALFYGGLTKKVNVLNTMFMSIIAYAITSVIWVLYGFPLAFGADSFMGMTIMGYSSSMAACAAANRAMGTR